MAEILISCGCVATWRKDGPLRSELIHCSWHAAAPELYCRLDDAIVWIEGLVDIGSAQYDSARLDWLKEGIALADGKGDTDD